MLYRLLTVLIATLWVTTSAHALEFTIDTSTWNGTSAIFEIDLIDGAPTASTISFGSPLVDGAAIASGGILSDSFFFNYVEFPLILGDLLSISMNMDNGTAPPTGFFPDSVSLFLLDTNYLPLFPTTDPTGADSLMLWDLDVQSPVAFAGSINMNTPTTPVPEPGTLGLFVIGILFLGRKYLGRLISVVIAIFLLISPAYSAGPPISDSTDYTSQVQMQISGLRLNRSTRTFDATATITNVSNMPIPGPRSLAIYDLPEGVILTNATAISQEGIPFLMMEGNEELALAETEQFPLKFINRTNQRFPISMRVVLLNQPVAELEQLQGPDFDQNGIRDDLEPIIDSRYGNDEELTSAATQILKGMRDSFGSTGSVESAFSAMVTIHKAYDCLESVAETEQSEEEAFFLRDITMDSRERIEAWLQLSQMLAGQSIPIGRANPCD